MADAGSINVNTAEYLNIFDYTIVQEVYKRFQYLKIFGRMFIPPVRLKV